MVPTQLFHEHTRFQATLGRTEVANQRCLEKMLHVLSLSKDDREEDVELRQTDFLDLRMTSILFKQSTK